MSIKIASWNINSVRARLPNIINWLNSKQPDILMLQELKTEDKNFPKAEFEDLGYKLAINPQKSWNGVAILSKKPIKNVKKTLPKNENDPQARYLEADINGIKCCCIYAPNGNPIDSEKYPYKLNWFDKLNQRASQLLRQEIPFIIGGDFNIIPEDKDCYEPAKWQNDALFKLEVRKKYRSLINMGLTDAYLAKFPDKQRNNYTFWDYQANSWQLNQGIRIDHFLVSPKIADKMIDVTIDKEERGKNKASDHVPIILEIKK